MDSFSGFARFPEFRGTIKGEASQALFYADWVNGG